MVLSVQPGAREGDRAVPPCPGGDRAAGAVLAGGQHPLCHGLPVTPEHALGDVPVVEDQLSASTQTRTAAAANARGDERVSALLPPPSALAWRRWRAPTATTAAAVIAMIGMAAYREPPSK